MGDTSEPAEPIRLLIVDDHEMLTAALSRLLDAAGPFSVVAVCRDAPQALAVLNSGPIDVALVDLRLDGEDGTTLVRTIRDRWPATAVLVVSGASDADSVRRAIDAGCRGYLLKGQPIHELTAAIETVARGGQAFAPDIAAFVARPDNRSALSAREIELLRLLVAGAPTADIAAELFISEHTVRNHVKSVLTKLGAHSRAEAVAIALRRRLVDIDIGHQA